MRGGAIIAVLAALILALLAVAATAPPEDAGPPAATTSPAGGTPADRRLEAWRRRALRAERRARERGAVIRYQRRALARLAAVTPPWGSSWLEQAFRCVHLFEGSWRDRGDPYWGGLQLDRDFQRTYGAPFYRAFGTADRWPVAVQIAVGIRGWLDRRFEPWPNTARRCGLR